MMANPTSPGFQTSARNGSCREKYVKNMSAVKAVKYVKNMSAVKACTHLDWIQREHTGLEQRNQYNNILILSSEPCWKSSGPQACLLLNPQLIATPIL